jgi:hypothetical protein
VKHTVLHALAIAAVLGAIARSAPPPASSDRDMYERVGRQVLIPGCSDIHCFRILVAGVLEHLPGPGLVKWKTYAVLANTGAAIAVGQFCTLLGLSASAAIAAAWICALGVGSLYTLFDSYTSDPLMYMLGPLMAVAVWQGRTARAGVMGAVGVFAKEFAWAPLWIFTTMATLERRWHAVARLLPAAIAVTAIWAVMHVGLMWWLHYDHGVTRSTHFTEGGYWAMWINSVGVKGAAIYLFLTFGALYVLCAAGLVLGGRSLRLLALASIPMVAAFLYVQQPERALWNFHFIVIPIAAVALQQLPDAAIAAFTASFGLANLRFGAQLPIPAIARMSLLASLVVAVVAVTLSFIKRTPSPIVQPA